MAVNTRPNLGVAAATTKNRKMKKFKYTITMMLGTLTAAYERLFTSSSAVPLPNSLGLINDNGIESLLVDPATVNLPFPGRYLLIKRGGSGYQYGDLCNGGAGGPLPLGPSSDSPYAAGDILNVRRLGNRRGLEIGIGVAGSTVTIDKLLVSAAGGCVQDVSTLATNGTYWVVGRAAASLTTTGSLMEVPYVPCVPWQIINTGGTLTVPANPV